MHLTYFVSTCLLLVKNFYLDSFLIGDATSAAGDGSVVQNSYDAIEGGGLMGKVWELKKKKLLLSKLFKSLEKMEVWIFRHKCVLYLMSDLKLSVIIWGIDS